MTIWGGYVTAHVTAYVTFFSSQTEVQSLRTEVAHLKCMLLSHKDCSVTKAMQDGKLPRPPICKCYFKEIKFVSQSFSSLMNAQECPLALFKSTNKSQSGWHLTLPLSQSQTLIT